MDWVVLLVAGFFEIAWAVGLKYSNGFSRLLPSALTIVCMILSFVLLAHAMKTLPLSTAYTVWTGIGILGSVILSMAFFGEPVTAVRVISIGLIVTGIVGLKLFG